MMAMRPSANVMLPGQSMFVSACRGISFNFRYAHTVPKSPMGTETMKMSRHWIGASIPPRTRPMNDPLIPAIWLIPSAIPRWCSGKASVRIADELAMSIAAPTPWKMRMITRYSAAAVPDIHVTLSRSEKNV